MGKTYPANVSNVKASTLSDNALLHIGKLIRSCAEIEDMLTLFICTLAELSEAKTITMLGKTAIRRRIEIAEKLANARDDAANEITKACFTADFFQILDCRNAVAHGVLLGKNEDGNYLFLTSKDTKHSDGAIGFEVAGYSERTICQWSEAAAIAVKQFEELWKVGELRKARLQRPLAPHPKGQRQRHAKP